MSSSSITRKTRSTNIHFNTIDESTIFDNLQCHQHSSIEFIHLFKEYSKKNLSKSLLINILCHCLTFENLDNQIILFIFDYFIEYSDYLNGIEFKQNLLPIIKQILINNNDLTLITIRLLINLIEYRPNILTTTITEWLSYLLNFLVIHITSINYIIYKDLIVDLFKKILKQFTPLSKEIIDILSKLSILSTNYLNQLKTWIKNSDDIDLTLFSIHLWQILTELFNRLVIRGHTKGNELLSVIEDAFIVSNYSIRSEAFHIWSIFMVNIKQMDDSDLLNNRLLKLFLTPFLSDSTSKNKLASISKCHSWITLINLYPKHVHDIILPFLSYAFGNHLTTTTWWMECRKIGGEFLQKFLIENIHSEYMIKSASDQILNYLFDSILDQLLEYNSDSNLDNTLWLNSWNAYLNHLMNIFKGNNSINDEQRIAINNCLLTRIEQFWIDSRIETKFLLKLFETFEILAFPLAIETVLCDSSIRTKTLSAAQIHPSSTNHKSQEKSSNYRTTLSDQYLHMMLEHAIRFNDDDQTIEECYLHVITYLIDTLSKTSDENFCYQTSSLLLKCSVEYSHQPIIIPYLFWHIWSRCSIHVTNILNRSHTFELNNKIDNQKQETSIELLLRSFSFNDIERLDYSYTLIWIQLFKSLCRLTLINNNNHLIDLFIELLRNEPAFEQAINIEHNQRLFGFILIILKNLLKTFSDIDLTKINDRSNNNFLSTIHKRSSISLIHLCFTQFSILINHILQRLLLNNENNIQFNLVCNCLLKTTTKISSNEQTKLFIFTYIRDLIIDLFNLCKTYTHLEIVLKNLIQLIPFLYLYEQESNQTNLPIHSSPISKQQVDNAILNKILTIMNTVFQPSNSSSLLQIIYPILILAFQHQKTIIRNKARKCWNETFGRLTFIVYPNELRACLRDLKDKEHLLLPCFLADHDNSNTAGSGPMPSSTDESQLSQQVDIPTPFISTVTPQKKELFSPARALPPINRSINSETKEPIFVPIIQNQINSPNLIGKRLSSKNSCLTEKQKEKLRIRDSIPLICDETSNTQSNSCTIDQTEIKTNVTLFNQTITNSIEEDISEESSIAKKLRRSSRSSISVRKSLKKKISIPITTISNTNEISIEQIQKLPIKSILKRLSPTKSRDEHKRRVVFNDQVKVLVIPSPSRRDSIPQQKRKDELKSPTRIIPKENLPLRKQPMSARRLSVMNNLEQILPSSSPMNTSKIRSSKLFHPNDALADWTQNQVSDPIFPSLINCEKSIDCLMNFLYDGLCPHDILNYFHSNKIHTVGDIARLTSTQIENSPIPSPKLTNIQKAFSLYQKHLVNSLSISSTTMINNATTTTISITSTSDETIPMDDNISTNYDTENKLYDVDTLIDSLDCEKLHLNDNQIDTESQIEIINKKNFNSPQKRCLTPINEKKPIQPNLTLGDRLQQAADIYKIKGNLSFNDDYIELIRQLFNNSSLTHLEKLHLKTLVLND